LQSIHFAHMCGPQLAATCTRPPPPVAGREYLIFCQGTPWRSGWPRRCRVDAIARTARAVLASHRTGHFLFEDGSLLTLAPNFLGPGSPWGAVAESSEVLFLEHLYRLREGDRLDGAVMSPPRSCRSCVDTVLGAARNRSARFGQIIALREDGSSLRYETERNPMVREAAAAVSSASTSPPEPATLVVLGGVRDMSALENRIVEEACLAYGIGLHVVSLGQLSELTSRCIKTLEALHSMGLLLPAFRRTVGVISRSVSVAGDGPPCALRESLQPAHGAPGAALRLSGEDRGDRILPEAPPLHIVVCLVTSLEEFIVRPDAATLIVDVFSRSLAPCYRNRALSLWDVDGAALTIRKLGMSKVLAESDALAFLQEQMRFVRPASLEEVLREKRPSKGSRFERNPACTPAGPRLASLHLDESAPIMRLPAAPKDHRAMLVLPVAVIVAEPSKGDSIRRVCEKLGPFARASVGHPSGALAFVSLLHNEGRLMPAIRCSSDSRKPGISGSMLRGSRPAVVQDARGAESGLAGSASKRLSWASVVSKGSVRDVVKPPSLSTLSSAVEGKSLQKTNPVGVATDKDIQVSARGVLDIQPGYHEFPLKQTNFILTESNETPTGSTCDSERSTPLIEISVDPRDQDNAMRVEEETALKYQAALKKLDSIKIGLVGRHAGQIGAARSAPLMYRAGLSWGPACAGGTGAALQVQDTAPFARARDVHTCRDWVVGSAKGTTCLDRFDNHKSQCHDAPYSTQEKDKAKEAVIGMEAREEQDGGCGVVPTGIANGNCENLDGDVPSSCSTPPGAGVWQGRRTGARCWADLVRVPAAS